MHAYLPRDLHVCHVQDDVPSFDDAQAFAIMEEELGRPLAAVFSSISEHPIAAASLGQVCNLNPIAQTAQYPSIS